MYVDSIVNTLASQLNETDNCLKLVLINAIAVQRMNLKIFSYTAEHSPDTTAYKTILAVLPTTTADVL